MMAARITDMTAHGGLITGPGCPTVLIQGLPAARMGDFHTCPMCNGPVPHVGGPIVMGCPTVLIGKMPAARQTDMCTCVGPPSSIIMGCTTVFIGTGGAGGGGGGGASAAQAATVQGLQSGSLSPVQGTETFPIEVQATVLQASKYLAPEEVKLQIELMAAALGRGSGGAASDEEQSKLLTIAQLAGILEKIESEESYEAARFFSADLNYARLTAMARAFVEGEDTNQDNDPNVMPTRFMLLYGADDNKLNTIDTHPDAPEETEHKITVANLRKGLIAIGHNIEEEGPFDSYVLAAFSNYMATVKKGEEITGPHTVQRGENLGMIAVKYGLPSWKYLYEMNRNIIGGNPDFLEPGTEITIPTWDATNGEEKIAEEGANPSAYIGGTSYRYPWTTFSITLTDESGAEYTETNKSGQEQNTFEERKPWEIRNADTKQIVATGDISASNELVTFIPDIPRKTVVVDGNECMVWQGGNS